MIINDSIMMKGRQRATRGEKKLYKTCELHGTQTVQWMHLPHISSKTSLFLSFHIINGKHWVQVTSGIPLYVVCSNRKWKEKNEKKKKANWTLNSKRTNHHWNWYWRWSEIELCSHSCSGGIHVCVCVCECEYAMQTYRAVEIVEIKILYSPI